LDQDCNNKRTLEELSGFPFLYDFRTLEMHVSLRVKMQRRFLLQCVFLTCRTATIAKDMCNAFEKATMSWAHAGAVACERIRYNSGILGFKLRYQR
jgi:hypothetical protein